MAVTCDVGMSCDDMAAVIATLNSGPNSVTVDEGT